MADAEAVEVLDAAHQEVVEALVVEALVVEASVVELEGAAREAASVVEGAADSALAVLVEGEVPAEALAVVVVEHRELRFDGFSGRRSWIGMGYIIQNVRFISCVKQEDMALNNEELYVLSPKFRIST